MKIISFIAIIFLGLYMVQLKYLLWSAWLTLKSILDHQWPRGTFNCTIWKLNITTEWNAMEANYKTAVFLTVWDFLVRVQIFVHIHGEVHHVCVAEEVQLSLKKLLFIVDLPQVKTKIFSFIWDTQITKTVPKTKKRGNELRTSITQSWMLLVPFSRWSSVLTVVAKLF